MNSKELIKAIASGELDARFCEIYAEDSNRQKDRDIKAIEAK